VTLVAPRRQALGPGCRIYQRVTAPDRCRGNGRSYAAAVSIAVASFCDFSPLSPVRLLRYKPRDPAPRHSGRRRRATLMRHSRPDRRPPGPARDFGRDTSPVGCVGSDPRPERGREHPRALRDGRVGRPANRMGIAAKVIVDGQRLRGGSARLAPGGARAAASAALSVPSGFGAGLLLPVGPIWPGSTASEGRYIVMADGDLTYDFKQLFPRLSHGPSRMAPRW